MKHANNFDALRVIAALLVIISHSWVLGFNEPQPQFFGEPLGSIGVYIFFVISGYLVSASWFRSPSISIFIKKRARRIYPALIINTILSIVVLGPLFTNLPIENYFSDLSTYSYLTNLTAIKLQANLPGVFVDFPVTAVNGSLWTMPYEIFCYAALVFILSVIKNSRQMLILIFIAVIIIRLVMIDQFGDGKVVEGVYYHVYFYSKFLTSFSIGVAGYLISVQDGRWRKVLPFLLIGLFVSVLLVSNRTVNVILVQTAYSVTVLWIALHLPIFKILPSKAGDWSYGLYIYAFPVQQILREYFFGSISILSFILVSVIATSILAALSWFLVEKPMLYPRSRRLTLSSEMRCPSG